LSPATERDVPLVLEFIRELAKYEKLLDRVEATEERLHETCSAINPQQRCVLGYSVRASPLASRSFTIPTQRLRDCLAMYLEDLFVRPEARGRGIWSNVAAYLARLTKEKGCLAYRVGGFALEQIRDWFYESLGAVPMDEWAVYRLAGQPLELSQMSRKLESE
jgi:GNAT superfamily N-acetyltransferase